VWRRGRSFCNKEWDRSFHTRDCGNVLKPPKRQVSKGKERKDLKFEASYNSYFCKMFSISMFVRLSRPSRRIESCTSVSNAECSQNDKYNTRKYQAGQSQFNTESSLFNMESSLFNRKFSTLDNNYILDRFVAYTQHCPCRGFTGSFLGLFNHFDDFVATEDFAEYLALNLIGIGSNTTCFPSSQGVAIVVIKN